jgi:hypothetical protein
MTKKKTADKLSEMKIQMNCFTWLWNEFPKTRRYFFHIANEGKRGLTNGIVSGVPDCFLAVPACGFHGLWVEFKKPGGRLSPAQKEILAKYKAIGYATAVIDNFEEFESLLLNYLPEELKR